MSVLLDKDMPILTPLSEAYIRDESEQEILF